VAVAVAMIRVFIENGDRTDRKKARLKYLIDKWGAEKYLVETQKKLTFTLVGFPLDKCVRRPRALRHGHIGVYRQKQKGKNYLGVVVPVGVMTAPLIPALNDDEMETILAAAAEAGATSAGYTLLRLPLEIKDLFREWLEAHAPDRAKHVMSLIRSMRGGKDYDATWGTRMRGTGPYASLIAQRFAIATRRLGLNRSRSSLDTSKFRHPPRSGDQLTLSI